MIVEQNTPLVVCGIIGDETTLVVNKCLTGPFKNRYDLPTAPVTLRQTLSDSVTEIAANETGLTTAVESQLGTVQWLFPESARMLVSIFYLLEPVGGRLVTKRPAYTAALSAGAERVPLVQLNWANSSPLVLQAKRYLATGTFPIADQVIASYPIPETPQFLLN
ncbi:phosphohydrolase [Lactiplantibacillus sp. WILCCON 0030]|uniref:Phosphohydrolase n=2 Tax=Lactiplantibacillus brownii TaxID=3069269 RepID=A0ABU1ACN4_9LACO|nr:phosphohydrolase [Lactiplantibacillus brownii]MDQ7938075.1 phosphohydrolase [Lactiplantibacillus brownii]